MKRMWTVDDTDDDVVEDSATNIEECHLSVQYTPSQNNTLDGIQPDRLFNTPKVIKLNFDCLMYFDRVTLGVRILPGAWWFLKISIYGQSHCS